MGMYYGGQNYIFSKNLQGDVIGIYNENRQLVAKYSYNAYGEIMSITDASGNDVSGNASHIANGNPFRYRGYYYDTETGFYYLQSRYYDPVVGRFLNADVYISTGQGILGNNMFAYCNNNPIMGFDLTGQDAIWLQDKDAVGGVGHTGLLLQDSNGKWYHFYWGDDRSGSMGKLGSSSNMFVEYTGPITFDSINEFYNKRNGPGKYETMIYLKGDFSKSVEYIRSISNQAYHLTCNNCVQVSMKALQRGKFAHHNSAYKLLLRKLGNSMIPNSIYKRFLHFHQYVGTYVSASRLKRVFMPNPYIVALFM